MEPRGEFEAAADAAGPAESLRSAPRWFVVAAPYVRLAAWFQLAWIASGLAAAWAGAPVHLGLIALLLPVLWVPAALAAFADFPLPTAVQVHYGVFLTAAPVLGSALLLYGVFPGWDKLTHLDSGVLLVWLGLFAVARAETQMDAAAPRWVVFSAAVVTPLAFAATWEIGEFLTDTLLGTQSQLGLADTVADMVAAGIGALFGLLLVTLTRWPRSILPRSLAAEARRADARRRARARLRG
ncbi:hypothetical protein ARHIZOSPH14_11600 [Agromyces rhizosphaerae]|uniref:Uncharacterized protein n=1 Tax=Agromyces rhizosphaerae TaxID=88374 RepID=A0A9W6CZW2_9MICO|nr:hypothetical protein [Agromyces rhizosphaerae]GLI26918.1 hypothetical protein ARHIZOSPH14_11600 [Agromyces rhizosphaerae]